VASPCAQKAQRAGSSSSKNFELAPELGPKRRQKKVPPRFARRELTATRTLIRNKHSTPRDFEREAVSTQHSNTIVSGTN
jgi:hypothetical protein